MPGSGVSLHAWWDTKREHPNAQTTLQMRSSDMYPTDTHYMIVDGDGNLVDLFYPWVGFLCSKILPIPLKDGWVEHRKKVVEGPFSSIPAVALPAASFGADELPGITTCWSDDHSSLDSPDVDSYEHRKDRRRCRHHSPWTLLRQFLLTEEQTYTQSIGQYIFDW